MLPTYHRQLPQPTKMHLSYNHLSCFPNKKSDIYQQFCKKLEKVSLRLEGQPSSGTCVAPFFNDKYYVDLDEDLEDEGDTRVDSAVWLDEEYKLTGQ